MAMTFQQLREHCLSRPGVTESFPFNETALVFKVSGKMFALTDIERLPLSVSLKCDPARAIKLREQYDSVRPGYHLNKAHWNTIDLEGGMTDGEVRDLIDHSYELVVEGLRRADREALARPARKVGDLRKK